MRQKRTFRALCALFIVLQSIAARDTEKSWSDWMSQGKALYASEKYAAAASAFQNALSLADGSENGKAQQVNALNSLAGAYQKLGRIVDAEHAYRRELLLVEKDEGQESLAYALVLAHMSTLNVDKAGRAEIVGPLRNAIERYSNIGPASALSTIRLCLARILMEQKRWGEAEPLLLDLRRNLLKGSGVDFISTSASLEALGDLRFGQGRYAESLDLYRESLHVLEASVGGVHATLVSVLNNIAASQVKMGRFEDAANNLERAKTVYEKTLGGDHPMGAALLSNYAAVLRKIGRKREAREMDIQAAQILKASNLRNGVGSTIGMSALTKGRP
jgi:tetratricopeptide (TPR) repeat protein